MSRLFKKRKKRPPRCPECGNRRHNKERKKNVWRCAACYHVFISDPSAILKTELPPPRRHRPEQIGIDIDDAEFEIY